MSALSSRNAAPPITLFEGAKTAEPIRVRNRAVLDALIIAALDPDVRGIAPAAPVTVMLNGVPVEHMPDFRLLTNNGAVVVDIQRPARAEVNRERFESVAEALADLGVAYERRRPPQVFGIPLLLNARSVWGCRRTQVSASDQVGILNALKAGPVPLAQVAQVIRERDGVAAVLALACRDLVVLDLTSGPLGPETLVQRQLLTAAASDLASMSERGN